MNNTIAIISITIYIVGITIALIAIIGKPFKQKYTIGTTHNQGLYSWTTTIVFNKKIVGIAYGKSKDVSIIHAKAIIKSLQTRQPQTVNFNLNKQ